MNKLFWKSFGQLCLVIMCSYYMNITLKMRDGNNRERNDTSRKWENKAILVLCILDCQYYNNLLYITWLTNQ